MNYDTNLVSKDNIYSMVRILSKQRTGLHIIHLNAQSLNNKMDEFRYIFTSSGVDIICISETWFHIDTQDITYNLPAFTLYRADRLTNAGGVCIYVRNELRCSIKVKSPGGNDIEYLFLEIAVTGDDKILLGCIYRPNRGIRIDPLISLLNELSLHYEDIILA